MGQDSTRAAMIYKHATATAATAVADALDRQIEALDQLILPRTAPNGTLMAPRMILAGNACPGGAKGSRTRDTPAAGAIRSAARKEDIAGHRNAWKPGIADAISGAAVLFGLVHIGIHHCGHDCQEFG